MYTANSSILYSKEKIVRILGTRWHQYLVNVSGLRLIPNKSNFKKN